MTDKRGIIIQAVKQCLRRNGCSSCENCPYTHISNDFECRERLKNDIIVLLKTQEPRVLTLEEVKASVGCDVWLELFGVWHKNVLTATTIDACGEHSLCTHYEPLSYEIYGVKYGWRMWTARPTEAQMEAVKWDDK